jgi:hypothetical protein
MSGASNITSVKLAGDDVIITGQVADVARYEVELLHVWLAQPGATPPGAGLAIDCLGGPHCSFAGDEFTLTAASKDFVGTFVEGPVTASAIAVLTPRLPQSDGLATQVLQWSQIITVT